MIRKARLNIQAGFLIEKDASEERRDASMETRDEKSFALLLFLFARVSRLPALLLLLTTAMKFLYLSTLILAAATGGAEEVPRNSGGRGAAPPADGSKPSAGPSPLDSEDLVCGKQVIFHFADGKQSPGFKDPTYGFMDHNGVAFPPTHQPTGWKPAPQ